jgi:hypothetical protein
MPAPASAQMSYDLDQRAQGGGSSTPYQNHLPSVRAEDTRHALFVENLDFSELMKNRHFQDLHQRWTAASSTMMETTQMNNSLLVENRELKAEIQRLKANESFLPYVQILFTLFHLLSRILDIPSLGTTPERILYHLVNLFHN